MTETPSSLRSVGARLSLSGERARQLEQRLLSQLRGAVVAELAA